MARGKVPVIGANDTIKRKARQEFLPSKHALRKLAQGNPKERSTMEFARRQPSGIGAPATYRDIEEMGILGIDLKK